MLAASDLLYSATEKKYSQLESQPDHILVDIAEHLSDADLISFAHVSERLRTIALAIIKKERSWMMWAYFPIDRIDGGYSYSTIGNVFLSNNGNVVSVAHPNISVWNTKTGTLTQYVVFSLRQAVLSPSGNILATSQSSVDHDTVSIRDVETGTIKNELRTKTVFKIALSPNGKLLAISLPNKVLLWNTQTGAKNEIKAEDINELTFSPHGKRLVLASPHKIELWKIKDLTKLEEFSIDKVVSKLSFLNDGRLIGTFHDRNLHNETEVLINDVQKNKPIFKMNFGPRLIGAFTLSPDGTLFAEASGNKIYIRDVKTRKIKRKITNEKDSRYVFSSNVTAMAFSPDNTILVTGDTDGETILWKLRLGK